MKPSQANVKSPTHAAVESRFALVVGQLFADEGRYVEAAENLRRHLRIGVDVDVHAAADETLRPHESLLPAQPGTEGG